MKIIINVGALTTLKLLGTDFTSNFVKKCGRILIIEVGTIIGGWGSGISSVINNKYFSDLKCPVSKLVLNNCPMLSFGLLEIDVWVL